MLDSTLLFHLIAIVLYQTIKNADIAKVHQTKLEMLFVYTIYIKYFSYKDQVLINTHLKVQRVIFLVT